MHKRFTLSALLALTFLFTSAAPALAQEAAAEGETEEEASPPLPTRAKRDTEEERVTGDVVGYKFPRGVYTMSDLGVFWRYLGFSDSLSGTGCFRCKYPTYFVSNAQPFIGFTIGYDVLPTIFDYFGPKKLPPIINRFGLSGQLSLATGYVDGAAPWSRARSRSFPGTLKHEESPKDHGIVMVHPSLAANIIPPPFERLLFEGRLFFGGAMFTPSAQRFQRLAADPNWWMSTFGVDFGFGLSVKYMTLLTNFIIGSDLALYTYFSPRWGTEMYLPGRDSNGKFVSPTTRICTENKVPEFGFANDGGVCSRDAGAPKKPVVMLPFVWATSFSPIIIKYVF